MMQRSTNVRNEMSIGKLPLSSQIIIDENHVIKFVGDFMGCKHFEIIRKPEYVVIYNLDCDQGLWTLKDADNRTVISNFELTKILTYAVKRLK